MKKNLIVLSLICIIVAVGISPVVALAATLDSIVNDIIAAAQVMFLGVAVVCFIIAGILFMTSQGDPDKLKLARSAALWGVAGVVIGVIAPTIIQFVKSFIHV